MAPRKKKVSTPSPKKLSEPVVPEAPQTPSPVKKRTRGRPSAGSDEEKANLSSPTKKSKSKVEDEVASDDECSDTSLEKERNRLTTRLLKLNKTLGSKSPAKLLENSRVPRSAVTSKSVLSPSPDLPVDVVQNTRFFQNLLNPHQKLTGCYVTKRSKPGLSPKKQLVPFVELVKTKNGLPVKSSTAGSDPPSGMDRYLCDMDIGFPFTWEPNLVASSQAAAPNLPHFEDYYTQISRLNPFKPKLDGFNLRKWLPRLEENRGHIEKTIVGCINFSSFKNVANLMRINYHEYYWHTTATGRLGGKLRTYLSASAFQGNPLPPPPTLWVTTGLVLDSFLEGHVKIEGNPDRNINTTYEKGIGIHLPSREFPRFVSVLQKLLDTPDIWLPTCKIEVDTNPNIKLDALVFGQFPSRGQDPFPRRSNASPVKKGTHLYLDDDDDSDPSSSPTKKSSGSLKGQQIPVILDYEATVPVYDGTRHLKAFNDFTFEALASLPRWPPGEIPTGSVVTVGHTVQKYQTNKGEDGNLGLNIHYVIVLYCPELVGSRASSPLASKVSQPSKKLSKGKGKAMEEEIVEETDEETDSMEKVSEEEDDLDDRSGSDEA